MGEACPLSVTRINREPVQEDLFVTRAAERLFQIRKDIWIWSGKNNASVQIEKNNYSAVCSAVGFRVMGSIVA